MDQDDSFLFPKHLSNNYMLTRTASFSELSTTKKVTTEERCQSFPSQNHTHLKKQYSCEEVYNEKLNSKVWRVKSDHEKSKARRPMTFPLLPGIPRDNLSEEEPLVKYPSPKSFASLMPLPNNERRLSKMILTPPRLLVNKRTVKPTTEYVRTHHTPVLDYVSDDLLDLSLQKPLPRIKKSSSNNDVAEDETTTDDEAKKNDSDENCTKLNTVDTTELKKRLRSLVRIEPKKSKSSICSWLSFNSFVVLLSIAAACMAYFLTRANFSEKFCSPRFEFGGISEDLKNRIYNQEGAIDELAKYFRDKNNETGFDVIALVGGIGVGKSYTAEIIKNRMKASANTIDVFPPLINKEDEAYASLSICRCNMIRLENLKTDDIPDAAAFADKLKKKAEGYCILTIALFNTQETDERLRKTSDLSKSISLIERTFAERKLEATLISYRSMSSEALTKCINDAANYSNVKLTNIDMENILQEMMIADSGCKGVYAKVQLRSSSSEL